MTRLFDVRAGEARGRVAGFAGLLLLIIGAHTILEMARDTLLLTGPGPKALGLVYMVIALSTVPCAALAARTGERFGQRQALGATLLIAILGPLLLYVIPMSHTMAIATYVLSGLVGSIVVPQFWTLVATALTVAQGRRLLGLIAAGGVQALGPILGGWLLTHYWWGWVFLINVPVCLAGVVAIFVLVPESRAHQRPGLDPVGVALSILGLVGLIYGLIQAGQHGWSNQGALLEMVCGVGLLVGFFFWERRLSRKPGGQPLLDVALFRLGPTRGG